MIKMKVDKNSFIKNLSLATDFSSTKLTNVSLLQGVLLRMRKNTITFFATDLNKYVKTSLDTTNKESLDIVIEPKKLLDFLSLIPSTEVRMEFDEKKVTVISGRTKGTFATINEKGEFPLPPEEAKDKKPLTRKILAEIEKKVLFAASVDRSRPVLSGVEIGGQDGELTVVATDGFRLSFLKIKNPLDLNPIVVSASFLRDVFHYLKKEKDVENVSFGIIEKEKMVTFSLGRTVFYSRLIEGEFPSYEKVIPQETKTEVFLQRSVFEKNIKLASVFVRDYSNILILNFKKEGLYIRPKDNSQESVVFQEIQIEGEEQEIAFNYRFLLDFTKNIDQEKISIRLVKRDAPAVFMVKGDEDLIHLIMPIRMDNP